jgi:Alpha galactosidase C-terminal beta sandwich domain
VPETNGSSAGRDGLARLIRFPGVGQFQCSQREGSRLQISSPCIRQYCSLFQGARDWSGGIRKVRVPWKSIGINAKRVSVRDLWMHKELGSSDALALSLRPRASVLVKVTAQ